MSTIYFEIQADDPERATRFYGSLFGWQFHDVKGLPVSYQSITINGRLAAGGMLKRPAPVPSGAQGTNAFVCSFQVNDFDAAGQAIVSMNGKVALPKFAIAGKCWQGYFIDTEGNTFGIFQVDDNAGIADSVNSR